MGLAKVTGAGRVAGAGRLAADDVPLLAAVVAAQRHGLDIGDAGRLDVGEDARDALGRLARRQQQEQER